MIIPIRSTCTMWPTYPVTELVGTAFKLGPRMNNSPSCSCVLHKTLNLVISNSRCCFVDYGEEMYQNLFRTCIAIVFSLNPLVLWRSRCAANPLQIIIFSRKTKSLINVVPNCWTVNLRSGVLFFRWSAKDRRLKKKKVRLIAGYWTVG